MRGRPWNGCRGRLLIHGRVAGLGLVTIRLLTRRSGRSQKSSAVLERQRLHRATKGDLKVVFDDLIKVEFRLAPGMSSRLMFWKMKVCP